MAKSTLYLRQKHAIAGLVTKWRDKPCNIKKLALKNNVPYQRLRNRLNNVTTSTTAYHKKTRVLSHAQKAELIEYIDFLNVKKSKARKSEIAIAVNKILRNSGI